MRLLSRGNDYEAELHKAIVTLGFPSSAFSEKYGIVSMGVLTQVFLIYLVHPSYPG